jgi:DNA-binding NtrC family response regulator
MSIKVMLIDDDQEFLDILAERLEIRGFEVATFISAQRALERLQHSAFDVIILDLQMPDMDGLQTLERLSEMAAGLPILLLTAHATVAKGVKAMKLGAADVLEKPVDIRVLVSAIETVATQKAGKPASGNRFNQFFMKLLP